MRSVRRTILAMQVLFALSIILYFARHDPLSRRQINRRKGAMFRDSNFLSQNPIVKPKPLEPITFLLPVASNDFGRIKILDTSFNKYFNFEGVREVIFLVLDHQYHEFAPRIPELAISKKVKVTLMNESEVVPEFAGNPPHMGWIKQQVIKLSAYRAIKTPFYMTLDSDIIATKPCGVKDLIVDGRGKTNMCPTDSERRPTQDTIMTWWNGAEKTLDLKIPLNETLKFGVTPAILSTEILARMADYVQNKFNKPLSKHLVDSIWNSYTEYAVYFVFASSQNLFYKFHTADFFAVYKDPHLNVWWRQMFDTWDGNEAFRNDTRGCFITMQSNTKLTAEQVWDKVKPWIQ